MCDSINNRLLSLRKKKRADQLVEKAWHSQIFSRLRSQSRILTRIDETRGCDVLRQRCA